MSEALSSLNKWDKCHPSREDIRGGERWEELAKSGISPGFFQPAAYVNTLKGSPWWGCWFHHLNMFRAFFSESLFKVVSFGGSIRMILLIKDYIIFKILMKLLC